ncbi:RagB/SusD family nutrient uptake outer membrane protein [Paraflavitalea pollutisoli]|uniref:RagB/SusD family nutrient uptake outer membrane protein n=1 Tax=Paraflavitalea pollutisoli TaxID=3034143 RepID=UPI0023EE2528|nr:RagB/SusD family nutrient uptake outer membrane protein [Paraflavitalea sp. H1-2-19X]
MCRHKNIFLSFIVSLFLLPSCKQYLDIVPDNAPTLDYAFTLRNEAQKFLFTCYAYLPASSDPQSNVGFLGGDEIWFPLEYREFDATLWNWEIARGNQNAGNPYVNYWDGGNYGLRSFEAIRQCNIFLENVSDLSKVPDLQQPERERWLAEAKFLKAYYHFLLLRMYGAIPLIETNIPVSAQPADVKVSRMPFDSCVNYIARLLDESAAVLPPFIMDRNNELGRVTAAIAKSIKARMLVMAASPQFNGNGDLVSAKNPDGTALYTAGVDQTKWSRAAQACKEAIELAEQNGSALYYFPASTFKLSPQTITQMGIRQAICERWNSEKIWGNSGRLANRLQTTCMARVSADVASNTTLRAMFSATLKMAELFHTKNGVPITEDKTLNFENRYTTRMAVDSERYVMEPGYVSARLNFDREPRFYANLGFDGGTWYLYSSPTQSDSGTFVLKAKANQYGGSDIGGGINQTGYFIKKLVDWNFSFSASGVTVRPYEWPEVRLADMYLLYAEALNESGAPTDEACSWLNKVRARAGLPSVQSAWSNYSINPSKYTTMTGLRDIIKRERSIEMAFEGSRFWDLRRWKDAAYELNQPVKGWSITGTTNESYYQVRTLFQQRFIAPRDYLWPIRLYNLSVNPNLVQNPGW